MSRGCWLGSLISPSERLPNANNPLKTLRNIMCIWPHRIHKKNTLRQCFYAPSALPRALRAATLRPKAPSGVQKASGDRYVLAKTATFVSSTRNHSSRMQVPLEVKKSDVPAGDR